MVPQRTIVALRPHATVFKPARRPAGAWIIPAELFVQFFFSMDNADTALYAGFGRITEPAFAHDLKSGVGRRI